MLDLVIVSLGAIVGANARWIISRYAARFIGPVFPYGTLIINIAGSLIVGFFIRGPRSAPSSILAGDC